MKFRTWEKWYWGIILSLTAIIIVAIFTDTFVLNILGRELHKEWSKTKQFYVVVPSFLGFFLVIWLICRLVGSDDKK